MSRINAGIPEHYDAIQYREIEDAIQAVQRFGRNRILIKRDFESAFRHISVSPHIRIANRHSTPVVPMGGRILCRKFPAIRNVYGSISVQPLCGGFPLDSRTATQNGEDQCYDNPLPRRSFVSLGPRCDRLSQEI